MANTEFPHSGNPPSGAEDAALKQQAVVNAEALLALKAHLLTGWRLLPVEHQASFVLVLINEVMQSEYQQWLQEAIALKWTSTPDQPNTTST